jgi:outer membrane protein assembly factor BamB
MPRDPQVLIFVGIKNSVVALDDRTGAQVWAAHLRGSDFVTLLWDGESLIAGNQGEVWRLDPKTGAVMWHNALKGMGRGVISLASGRHATTVSDTDAAAAKRRRDQAAASTAAAGATVAAAT